MMTSRKKALLLGAAFVAIVFAACGENAEPEASPKIDTTEAAGSRAADAASVDLIDRGIPPAVAGEEGWDYALTLEKDFDADGEGETVVLTARVEMRRGRPAWDDGQPWQVYVEEPDGARTYLYAQRLQLGTLTLRVTTNEPPGIILLEHLPDRMSLYEASYAAPDSVSVARLFERSLDPRGDLASPTLP